MVKGPEPLYVVLLDFSRRSWGPCHQPDPPDEGWIGIRTRFWFSGSLRVWLYHIVRCICKAFESSVALFWDRFQEVKHLEQWSLLSPWGTVWTPLLAVGISGTLPRPTNLLLGQQPGTFTECVPDSDLPSPFLLPLPPTEAALDLTWIQALPEVHRLSIRPLPGEVLLAGPRAPTD